MRAHAVVIGIDHYPRSEWCLTGAVRDAVAFARWAVTGGGVDPDAVTLLLSPLGDAPPLDELLKADQGAPDLSAQAASASWDSVRRALYEYEKGRGKGADRLWFYYAGHGLAPPMQDTGAGPLVVPSDIDDLDFYVRSRPIGLETFRGFMEDVAPKEQFFFVDACRDVLPTTGNKVLSQQLLWDLRSIDDEALATQLVLLATTAGQRAKEIRGHGLFGRALLAALRGLGPELRPPTAPPAPGQPARRRLLFDDVVKFVIAAVQRGLRDLPGVKDADLKGVPYARVNRLTGDVSIADFTPDTLPTAKVSAIVDPAVARPSTRIEFLQWNEDQGEFIARKSNPAPLGPPVPEEAVFEVRGGSHHLRITADGFEEEIREILVYEDKRYPIELRTQAKAEASPTDDTPISFGLPAFTMATIVVRCPDELARVAVVDGGGQERGRGYGELRVDGLAPGPYRVSAELTSADRTERTVHARAGETHEVSLDVAAPPPSPTLTQCLRATNIQVDDNYTHPSENFGPVAGARLGSILAYAAWAARWPDSAGFYHLRAMQVDSLPELDSRGSAVQVLIGDVSDASQSFAGSCRVQVEWDSVLPPGTVLELGSGRSDPLFLKPLPAFPVALQGSAVLPPGPIRVRVEMPGFAPLSFAVALLPGFVTALILSREQDGDVDVQQHLNPIDPLVPVAPGFEPPMRNDVRLVELAWRALETRDPLDAIEHKGLIEGKRSNPMLGVIVGYRMLRTERAEQFRGSLEPPPKSDRAGSSPLWNMVNFFPGLPDVHVLAGLYDPSHRDEHFQRAMDTGTPVLVEGFWTLLDWLTARAMSAGTPPPVLRQNVMPAMAWTSFADSVRTPGGEAVQVVTTAGRSYRREASDDRLLELSRSVGRLEAGLDRAQAFQCTTFLLAPQVAVCPIHFVSAFAEERSDGTWTMKEPLRVIFDPSDPSSVRQVTRIVRTLRPPSDSPVDGGSLDREMLDQCWPVLLALSEPANAPPLPIATSVPPIGQRVAVIGFSRRDAPIPSKTFARHFSGSAGDKHAMPGSVLRSPGTSFTLDYDCFTAEGTSGGPVIELDTGTVVGMHVAGYLPPEGRKRGVAIAMTRFDDPLAGLAIVPDAGS